MAIGIASLAPPSPETHSFPLAGTYVFGGFGSDGQFVIPNRKNKLKLSGRIMKLVITARSKGNFKPDCLENRGRWDWGRTATKLTAALLVGAAVLTSSSIKGDYAYALAGKNSVVLFQRSCVGCHVGGGNILQPGATLTYEDLLRNGLSTVDDIYNITYSGKGRMPGFGEKCTPRGQCTFGPRLSDEDIRALAEFVRLQADQGWPTLEPIQ